MKSAQSKKTITVRRDMPPKAAAMPCLRFLNMNGFRIALMREPIESYRPTGYNCKSKEDVHEVNSGTVYLVG